MKTNLLLILLLTISSQFTFAQDIGYELTVLNEDYERLNNPTILTEGIWDDPTFVSELGFEFEFDSTTYTRVAMNDDNTGGLLYFDVDAPPTNIDILIAYFSDVIDPGYLDSKSLGYIASATEGEPGARIFKMEWNNVGFYNEIDDNGTANNIVNFQLWLYEGSNDIEWHFGPQTIKDSQVHDLGAPLIGLIYDLDINTGDEFESLVSIAGDINDPALDVITDLSVYPSTLDGDPLEGTVYRLSSLFVSNNNIPTVESSITVSPTLATDELNVRVDFQNNEVLDLKILDLLGRDWSSISDLTAHQTLDISNLPVGNYFVNIRSKDAVWTQKIIKQ